MLVVSSAFVLASLFMLVSSTHHFPVRARAPHIKPCFLIELVPLPLIIRRRCDLNHSGSVAHGIRYRKSSSNRPCPCIVHLRCTRHCRLQLVRFDPSTDVAMVQPTDTCCVMT